MLLLLLTVMAAAVPTARDISSVAEAERAQNELRGLGACGSDFSAFAASPACISASAFWTGSLGPGGRVSGWRIFDEIYEEGGGRGAGPGRAATQVLAGPRWSAAPVTSPCKARVEGAEDGVQGWGGAPLSGPSPVSVGCLRPSGRVGDQEVRTCFIFICFCLRVGTNAALRSPPPLLPTLRRPRGPGRSDGSQEEVILGGLPFWPPLQLRGGNTCISQVPPPVFSSIYLVALFCLCL